jgi:undecaprenyl-diphosphatase
MNYLQILVLALVQGAAELLPVSSSAHVILSAKLMGIDPSEPSFTFLLVMLHTGTMFAVLYYFWPRWRWLLFPSAAAAGPDKGPVSRGHFLKMIVLASACTAVLGGGLILLIEKVVFVRLLHHEKGEVEHLFKSLPLMAAALFAVGVFILVAGYRAPRNAANGLSVRSALWIGIVQAICLPLRGFSRSGATISTALCCGVERRLAEEFSFALALVLTPAAIAWELLRLLRKTDWTAETHVLDLLLPGLVGMVFSCVAGIVALKVLSAVLEKGRWSYFGYYCLAAALVVLTAAWWGY